MNIMYQGQLVCFGERNDEFVQRVVLLRLKYLGSLK